MHSTPGSQTRQKERLVRTISSVVYASLATVTIAFVASACSTATQGQPSQTTKPNQTAEVVTTPPTPPPPPVETPPKRVVEACVVNGLSSPLVGPQDVVDGPDDAPITLVEFSDLQCPFCKVTHENLNEVSRQHRGQIRRVWKNAPLAQHAFAQIAAEAAQGVFEIGGPLAFGRFVSSVQNHDGDLPPALLAEFANSAGVSGARISNGLEQKRWEPKIKGDLDSMNKLGIDSIPFIFINGRQLNGEQSLSDLNRQIDEELANLQENPEKGAPGKIACGRIQAAAGERVTKTKLANNTDGIIWKVPISGAPMKGPANALVTIVQFSDFQCPFCKRVEPTINDLVSTYGDRIRIVWKDQPLPFHNRAKPAANFAREAMAQKGVGAFWQVQKALFDSAPKLEDSDFAQIAQTLRLPANALMNAVKNDKYAKEIEADSELAEDVTATGTPTFFINGRRLVGAQAKEAFSKIIDEELAKAELLVAKGTAPQDVYAQIMSTAQGVRAPEVKIIPLPAATKPTRGNANAAVTIQIFSDFQCPFCERVRPTLDKVMANYGQKVKIVWRDLPLDFHKDAPLAAEAAAEVFRQKGNTGFWAMHDLIFKNQSASGIKRPVLEQYAASLGCDLTAFNNALDTNRHKAAVDSDIRAAHSASISGTPAFVIGKYYISGAQPYSSFKRVIEYALAHP